MSSLAIYAQLAGPLECVAIIIKVLSVFLQQNVTLMSMPYATEIS